MFLFWRWIVARRLNSVGVGDSSGEQVDDEDQSSDDSEASSKRCDLEQDSGVQKMSDMFLVMGEMFEPGHIFMHAVRFVFTF